MRTDQFRHIKWAVFQLYKPKLWNLMESANTSELNPYQKEATFLLVFKRKQSYFQHSKDIMT